MSNIPSFMTIVRGLGPFILPHLVFLGTEKQEKKIIKESMFCGTMQLFGLRAFRDTGIAIDFATFICPEADTALISAPPKSQDNALAPNTGTTSIAPGHLPDYSNRISRCPPTSPKPRKKPHPTTPRTQATTQLDHGGTNGTSLQAI